MYLMHLESFDALTPVCKHESHASDAITRRHIVHRERVTPRHCIK